METDINGNLSLKEKIKKDSIENESDHGDIEKGNLQPISKENDSSVASGNHTAASCVCPICLGEFEQNEEVCKSKNVECQHFFHLDCMMQWLMHHDECPLCRTDYLKDSSGGSSEGNHLMSMEGQGLSLFPVTLSLRRSIDL